MVVEFGSYVKEDGQTFRKQYFVYTNGINTYSFGEYIGDFLYETTPYIFEVESGCHFGFTSNWGVDALIIKFLWSTSSIGCESISLFVALNCGVGYNPL